MPTSYTNLIENGTITTGKDFLKKCLRNFGVMYDYLEDPLSEEIEIDWDKKMEHATSYHRENIKINTEKLEALRKCDYDEYKKKMVNGWIESLKRYVNLIDENNKKNEVYDRIRKEIVDIDVDKDLEDVKKFALNQIDISKEDNDYWFKQIKELCGYILDANTNVRQTYEADIEYYENAIKMSEDSLNEAIKRVNDSKVFYEKAMRTFQK